jgi:predicted RNase H-like HicB family nuclease
MFEFHLRIPDVGEGSFLGIVEGFPEVLVHATSPAQAEADLIQALIDHLQRLQDREATRIDWDDFPTVRTTRLFLNVRPG